MANQQERAELHKTIWKIANDLRGSVDGWEFNHFTQVVNRIIDNGFCQLMSGIHDNIALALDDSFCNGHRNTL